VLVTGLLVRSLSVIRISESFSAAHAAPFENADDLIDQEELLFALILRVEDIILWSDQM
jgi:hypothetical protein